MPTRTPQERAAIRETQVVLEQADHAYAGHSCPASGDCCHFSKTNREPWLWEPEWLVLKKHLQTVGRAVPTSMAEGNCPFLEPATRRCTVYAARPFGCRTFFCSRRQGPAREPLEAVNALLLRLEKIAMKFDPEAAGPKRLSEWIESSSRLVG